MKIPFKIPFPRGKDFRNRFIAERGAKHSSAFPAIERKDLSDTIIKSDFKFDHLPTSMFTYLTAICQQRNAISVKELHENLFAWLFHHIQNSVRAT